MIKGIALALLAACSIAGLPVGSPVVFPVPQEMELKAVGFALENPVRIVLPATPSENDLLLAREFAADLSDWHGSDVRTEKTARLPGWIRVSTAGMRWTPTRAAAGGS